MSINPSSKPIDPMYINKVNPLNMQDPSSGIPLRPAVPIEIAQKVISYLSPWEGHRFMTLNKSDMFAERLQHHQLILSNKSSLTLRELKQYQRILSLDLSNKICDPFPWTKSLSRLIKEGKINLQNLKNLDLSGNTLSDDELIELVKACPNLTSINLAGSSDITDKAITALAKSCPRLTSINLADCLSNITEVSAIALAKGCPGLTEINFAGCYQISARGIVAIAENCASLASLDLTWVNDISHDAFRALSKCPITSLNLSRLVITDETLQLLATLFPNLTSIDLSSPCLGSNFSGESLKAFILAHPQLSSISLLNQGNLSNLEALVSGDTLKSIHLSLSEDIPCAYFLGLAGRYPDFFAKIKTLDCKNHSYAQNDDLTDENLLNILHRCPNLLSLSLEGCKNVEIKDAAFQSLPELKNLLSINLSGSGANTDAGIATLTKNCPNLTSICLGDGYYITDAALSALARNCPNLTSIQGLTCSPRITDQGLYDLAKNCSKLALIFMGRDRDIRYRVTAEGFKKLRETFPDIKIHVGW